LITQTNLFHVGKFNFKLHHLIIIGILILSFSTSYFIRSQGGNYGFELNEFDPFFNFRATEYIVDNGFSAYFEWHDEQSWYPKGRNISDTSQVMLHTTAAITYQLFGGNSNLYDFTILFPVVIGSLTVVVIFVLVRLFGGTTAGLLASLFFAVSIPILLRGPIGWFKSEPLGIFYALIGLYLFLSGIKSKNKKIIFSKIVFGGIFLSFSISSWGGNQFFIIPISVFICTLPFIRKDHKFLIWTIPLFVTTFILITSVFEKSGQNFVFGLGGISLIFSTLILIGCIFIQKISKDKNKIRNGLLFLISIIIAGSFLVTINIESEFLPLPSFRYLNAINPFLTSLDPLVDSVAEHATPSIQESFLFHSILMIFSGIGIWIILSKNQLKNKIFIENDIIVFLLIITIFSVYLSSAFIRLEVFASLSLIFLGSIGLSVLIKEIFKIESINKKNSLIKISFVGVIVILFAIPLNFPTDVNQITALDFAPTILNGGTSNSISNDWLDTLEWIKNNTPEDAVIASWWDYGYWIQTMAERATLADNSTIHTRIIENIARIFASTPDDGWNMLKEMEADYFVIFLSVQKLDIEADESYYLLKGGADESKRYWFMKIAGVPLAKYVYPDGISGTDYFWNETLFGKLIPFNLATYYHPETDQQSLTYQPGFIPVYTKDIKYDSTGNTPLKLVYSSPSFVNDKFGTMNSVLVYQINENYTPNNNP
jgi:dolichyl-diphosphooligosaccharide---protein glycosyltransferase